jgi:hypothetical protein
MEKFVEHLNFKVDISQLQYYYDRLKTEFQMHNWSYANNLNDVKEDIYSYNKNKINKDANGWAITFPKYLENGKAIAPWTRINKNFVVDSNTLIEETKTPMVFGLINELLNQIPYARNISLTVLEPGSHIVPHTDEDYLLRVHIPIYTSKHCQWLTVNGLEPMYEMGQAYLCDTRQMHSIYNDGSTDRVHLLFAIDPMYEEHIKSITGVIKLDGSN